MDPYKTPTADLTTETQKPYKPVKAVLYGLSISIIITAIVSMVEGIGFGIALGVNFDDQDAFESALANSTAFMVTDVFVSTIVFYFAGRVVGKYVPGKELKYGIIVTVVTLAVYLPLLIDSDAFSSYPVWYNLLGLVVLLVVIPFGAISAAKN